MSQFRSINRYINSVLDNIFLIFQVNFEEISKNKRVNVIGNHKSEV